MPRTSSALPGPRTAFIPALRHEVLTPAYDFLILILGRRIDQFLREKGNAGAA